MAAVRKEKKREKEPIEDEEPEGEEEPEEEEPAEEEDEEDWPTIAKAGAYLKTQIRERLMKPVAAVRAGRAEKRDLPTTHVGTEICKIITKLVKTFVKARKRAPKKEGVSNEKKGLQGIHGLALVTPGLADFINKHFPVNVTGQPPISANRLTIRGLVTSLMSAYFRLKGLKRKDRDGKVFIFPDAELLKLLDVPLTLPDAEPGSSKSKEGEGKSKVFDEEDVSREKFKYTDLHKLLKYQYVKTAMPAYIAEKKVDRAAEETRIKRIKDEAVAQTASVKEKEEEEEKEKKIVIKSAAKKLKDAEKAKKAKDAEKAKADRASRVKGSES